MLHQRCNNTYDYHDIGQRPPVFGGGGHGSDDFDITDVTDAIKNNGTGVDIATKILSLLAKHTERSDSNSMFMMWTIPTTILALMGIVYFVGKLNNHFDKNIDCLIYIYIL